MIKWKLYHEQKSSWLLSIVTMHARSRYIYAHKSKLQNSTAQSFQRATSQKPRCKLQWAGLLCMYSWQWADKNCNRTSVFHIWMYWGTLQRRSLLQNNSILWWRRCPIMDPGRAPTLIILRSLLKSFCMHVHIVEARIFFSPSHLSPKHK